MITKQHLLEATQELREYLQGMKGKTIVILHKDVNDAESWTVFLSNLMQIQQNKFNLFSNVNEINKDYDALFICSSFLSEGLLHLNIKEINDFKNAHKPIIVLLSLSSDANIKDLHDKGVDYIVSKNNLFTPGGKMVNKEALYSFINTFHYLLIKGEVLDWFWKFSLRIKENVEAPLNNFPGKHVIDNPKIRERVFEKLKIGIGHLRKPITDFEGIFDFTSEEFAFLTYWSCINEIKADWIEFNPGTRIKKLKTGYEISTVNSTNLEESTSIEEYKITDETQLEIIKKFSSTEKDFNKILQKGVPAYRISNDNKGKHTLQYTQSEIFNISVILLFNQAYSERRAINFFILSKTRNELSYIHSNIFRVRNLSMIADYNVSNIYQKILMIFGFLYFLLSNWEELPDSEMESITKKIFMLDYFIGKLKGENKLKLRGLLQKDISQEANFYHFYIKTSKPEQKIKMQIQTSNKDLYNKLNNIKGGEFIEVFFHLTEFKQKNSSSVNCIVDELFLVKK